MPMPVTATSGRPGLGAVMAPILILFPSAARFDPQHALAAPVADRRDRDLAGARLGDRGRPRGRRRTGARASMAVADEIAEGRTARAGREAPEALLFLAGDRPATPVAPEITASGMRERRLAATWREARRDAARRRARLRSLARAPSRARGRAPRASACARASSTRKPRSCRGSKPPRGRRAQTAESGAVEQEAAHLVDEHHVGPRGVVGAADEEGVALVRGDARQGDPQGVDAGGLLAHEGARGAGDAVHDGDVAGEQVRELRQEQRRAEAVRQPLVE